MQTPMTGTGQGLAHGDSPWPRALPDEARPTKKSRPRATLVRFAAHVRVSR